MTEFGSIRYTEPSQRAGMRFMQQGIKGSIVMLNLLRFRDVADYTANPELTPEVPISGAEAFNRTPSHFSVKTEVKWCFLAMAESFLLDPKTKDGILSC